MVVEVPPTQSYLYEAFVGRRDTLLWHDIEVKERQTPYNYAHFGGICGFYSRQQPGEMDGGAQVPPEAQAV